MRLLSLLAAVCLCLAPNSGKAAPYGAKEMMRMLEAPPKPGPRPKKRTIGEVKKDYRLRTRMRGVDINTINFGFDATAIAAPEKRKLRNLATALRGILARRPYEIFLIEGHTDAVGSAEYNLDLSRDRAQAVARVLVARYGLPPGALETAGYGEQYPKVKSAARERRNRRVTVRRITDLVDVRRHRHIDAYQPDPPYARAPYWPYYPPFVWD